MARTLTRCQLIERSINKRFRKELWAPFMTAIIKYELIRPGDKIAVCISGGKDSMLMAKLMQELHKHTRVPFDIIFLCMDPGYNPINREKIESNARLLEVPLTIFETDIFDVANNQEHSPCYLCARMRRGHLYSKAKELGCNKIALGHHMSDVIETVVMAMFNSSKLETMIPKVHSLNFEGMELIRPMYRIKEEDVLAWCRYNDLEFIRCACRFTEAIAASRKLSDQSEELNNNPSCSDSDRLPESLPIRAHNGENSRRQEIKDLIRELKKTHPGIEDSIFNAVHAVQLDTVPGYKTNGEMHSFTENYSD